MSTTVRIREEDKARLQRLQEAWRARKGERPTQQEIIRRILRYVEQHEDQFFTEAAWRPLTPDEFNTWRRRVQGRYGGGWTDDIDATVYDEED